MQAGNNDLFEWLGERMLPGGDRLEICWQTHYTPIIIIGARSRAIHRLLNPERSDDDYLEKPFPMLSKVFSYLSLLDQVWGYQHEGYEQTVNTRVKIPQVESGISSA